MLYYYRMSIGKTRPIKWIPCQSYCSLLEKNRKMEYTESRELPNEDSDKVGL